MYKKTFTFFIFLLMFELNTFLSNSYAETLLQPVNATFIIVSIRLSLVDQDYTRNKQYLGILGDKNRLDIFWDARYEPQIQYPGFDVINVTCWLNCNATNSSDINMCNQYQSCSYFGATGLGSCTILTPNYNYSRANLVVCRFSNPNYPDFEFVLSDLTYPRRVFYPIRYSISSVGGVYTLGSIVSLPVSFLSYSLLKSNYTAYIYIKPENIEEIATDNTHNTTRVLEYGEMDTVYPKISFLIQRDNFVFYINTTANELPTFTSVAQCPPSQIILGRVAQTNLINNRCVYSFEVVSGSVYLSMQEYDILYFFIILFGAILIFLFFLIEFR